MKGTDADLIDRLGGTRAVAEALPLKGQSIDAKLEVVKKWRRNGIPWKHRGDVMKLARSLGKRLPADFLTERRPQERALANDPQAPAEAA